MIPMVEIAIGEFLRENPDCFDGTKIRGECNAMSTALQARLPGAKKIHLSGYRLKPRKGGWTIPTAYWSHTALLVGSTVIDVTARQFDPSLPVPRLMSLEEMNLEWRDHRVV